MTAVRRLVRHYIARQPYKARHARPEQDVPELPQPLVLSHLAHRDYTTQPCKETR